MSLAIEIYRGNAPRAMATMSLLLSAWDERDLLRQDIPSLVSRELANEMHAGARGVGRYLVEDPYGEEALSPGVRRPPDRPTGQARSPAAPGYSLLHGLAGLSAGGTACVIGDPYPTSRTGFRPGAEPAW